MLTERTLSIVIACYRDAGSVRETHRRLSEMLASVTPHYEIIFVNDASPDDAESILHEIAASDSRVVVVNHTRNFGSQNAFLSGMRVARGDAIVLMDGDLQDPPSLIPRFVDEWLEGNLIVYGRRVDRRESLSRRVLYKVFYRIFNGMAPFSVPLDAGDFGLIDRRVVETILSGFDERLVFLRGLRAYTGYKSSGVDYIRDARFDGVSTNSFLGNVRWAKLAIFSFSKVPLEWISFLAGTTVLLTMFGAVFYLAAYFLSLITKSVTAPPGYMTLLMVVLFLGSVQLVGLSILAEYLGHIFEEVKGRPRYVVRDVVDHREPLETDRPGPTTEDSNG